MPAGSGAAARGAAARGVSSGNRSPRRPRDPAARPQHPPPRRGPAGFGGPIAPSQGLAERRALAERLGDNAVGGGSAPRTSSRAQLQVWSLREDQGQPGVSVQSAGAAREVQEHVDTKGGAHLVSTYWVQTPVRRAPGRASWACDLCICARLAGLMFCCPSFEILNDF